MSPCQQITSDLDQSDVESDAQTMMQKEFEEWGEHLDGADLYTVILVLIGENMLIGQEEDPISSRIVQELIGATQSNPQKAEYALRQMIDLDNAMSDL